jgi:hypothetical protein
MQSELQMDGSLLVLPGLLFRIPTWRIQLVREANPRRRRPHGSSELSQRIASMRNL